MMSDVTPGGRLRRQRLGLMHRKSDMCNGVRAPQRQLGCITLLAAAVLTAVSGGAAVGARLRFSSSSSVVAVPKSAYIEQETAKQNICAAYREIAKAIVDGHEQQFPDDDVSKFAKSIMVRQRYMVGSVYLAEVVDAEPAAPAEIVNSVRHVIYAYEELVRASLAADEVHDAITDADSADNSLTELCRSI